MFIFLNIMVIVSTGDTLSFNVSIVGRLILG